jgi:hypothetical protein
VYFAVENIQVYIVNIWKQLHEMMLRNIFLNASANTGGRN